MRQILLLIVITSLFVACKKTATEQSNIPVVKVGTKVLHKDELDSHLPKGLAKEDSIIAAEHYIRVWINEHLLYDVASNNIRDKENINQLVEDYRKSLIIYQYQEQLINEKLSKEIDNESMMSYYNANKDKFKLDRPLIKGIFLKIPSDAPQIDKVRVWYKSTSPSAIENIEKYSIQNAVIYDYFTDHWVDFNELMDNLPANYNNEDAFIRNNKNIEYQDKNYYYFLNIVDYLLSGDNAPYEYARPTIREMLINQNKIEFLKKTENDLYQKALNKGQIIFFNE